MQTYEINYKVANKPLNQYYAEVAIYGNMQTAEKEFKKLFVDCEIVSIHVKTPPREYAWWEKLIIWLEIKLGVRAT